MTPLQPTSPIYLSLANLKLMNLLVGDNDVTCDKDYKHIFKHIRNLLLRERGIWIDGTHITPSLIHHHLAAEGMDRIRINYLFKPDDRQDMTLVTTLLKAIWSLPAPINTEKPTFIKARHALFVLGRLMYWIVAPYIRVQLNLSDQMEYLSAAAHLTLALYRRNNAKSRFIPTQLYNDIMHMVKNAYFCCAKSRINDLHGSFWLILLGTDRLETAFGILRTMIGNDANADMLQLLSRLSSIAEVQQTLAAYPHLDRVPRRLRLPSLDEPGDIVQKVDQINPASWVGDVRVGTVVLQTTWSLGRRRVETEVKTIDITAELAGADAARSTDILSPFGIYAAAAADDPLDNELDELDANEQAAQVLPQDAGSDTEMDLEDVVGSDHVGAGFAVTVDVEGKPVHKARILREFFKYKNKVGSTDRLKRVANLPRYNVAHDTQVGTEEGSLFGQSALLVGDPVTCLMQCQNKVFLAVAQVSTIKYRGIQVQQTSPELLIGGEAMIGFQIMRLVPRQVDNRDGSEGGADWEWSGKYETAHKIDGRFVQPIDPVITAKGQGDATYLFRSDELRAFASCLYDRQRKQQLADLRKVKPSVTFPYRAATGECSRLISGGLLTLLLLLLRR